MKLFIVTLAFMGYLGTCRGSDEGKVFNVTLSVFSGVPNPQWLITPKSLNYKKIKELLGAAKSKKAKYLPEQMPPQLGYKGFLVQEDGEDKPSLIVGPKTTDLQEELLKSCPPKTSRRLRKKMAGGSLLKVLAKVIKTAKIIPVALKVIKALRQGVGSKRYPPVFEGAANIWNTPSVQPNNNCYNYGNDLITNTFAQPGKGSGQMYRRIDFEEVTQAAIRDGLRVVQPGPGGSIPYIPPHSPDHLVALVVDPGVDFHWYRLDSNGRWSHKPGSTPITNKDGHGNLIYDPREAANSPGGINYEFVCFMKTNKYEVTIR